HESTVVSWLASLAPPPGLRPYSPVPLPFHGGEVRFARAPSRPLAVLPRSTAVSRGRSPLRSRTLPAFGRTPPFHCRSTGEKSVCSRTLPAFGTSPPFHCRSTGENPITDLPWRGEDQGRHHVPRVVRRAIGCFHRGAGHRGRDPRGGVDRPPLPRAREAQAARRRPFRWWSRDGDADRAPRRGAGAPGGDPSRPLHPVR